MSQPYVGEVRIFGGNFAPAGWAFCNGQLMPISENEALFYLIGTTYGGDGESTFALPDLACRVPLGTTSGQGWILGQMGGQESVTLTTQQMPSHTHAVLASDAPATSTDPSQKVWASWADSPYSTAPTSVGMEPTSLTASGGNQPHENRGPALGLSFIISLFGIYPSQY